MSKTSNQHSCITLFCTFLCRPCTTTTTWNDQIFSWLENGKCKVINYYPSLISDADPSLQFQPSSNWLTWYNGEKNSKNVKSIFQGHFHWRRPLSDRKVPNDPPIQPRPQGSPSFSRQEKEPPAEKDVQQKSALVHSFDERLTNKRNCLQTDQYTRFLGIARRPLQSLNVLPQVRSQLTTFNLYSVHELSCYEHWYFWGTVTSHWGRF